MKAWTLVYIPNGKPLTANNGKKLIVFRDELAAARFFEFHLTLKQRIPKEINLVDYPDMEIEFKENPCHSTEKTSSEQ